MKHQKVEVSIVRKTKNECLQELQIGKECLDDAEKLVEESSKQKFIAQTRYDNEYKRLEHLKSGKGVRLAQYGPARAYEYWLDLPGYSGSIYGATAKITEYGSIQYVSDVKGNSTGGIGGAVVGGAVMGPVGAVVGATVKRKITISTEIQEKDNRQFELQITGQGFAWSTTKPAGALRELQHFRDVVNARSTSVTSTLEDDSAKQEETVRELKIALERAIEAEREAILSVEKNQDSLNTLRETYLQVRRESGVVFKIRNWFRQRSGF